MIAFCILELDKLLAYIYSILDKDPTNGEIIKAVLPVLAVLITWPSSVKILQSPIFSLIVDHYIKDPQYALDSCLVLIEFLCSGLPFDGASELIQIFQIVIVTLKNISDDFTTLPYKIKQGFLVMFDKYVKQFNSIFDQPELRDLIREAYSWIMQVIISPNDDDETNSLIEKCYNIWLHSYNQHLYRCSLDSTNFIAEFMPHLRRIIIATYPSPYNFFQTPFMMLFMIVLRFWLKPITRIQFKLYKNVSLVIKHYLLKIFKVLRMPFLQQLELSQKN